MTAIPPPPRRPRRETAVPVTARRKAGALVTLAGGAVLVALVALAPSVDDDTAPAPTPVPCAEDMPCWDGSAADARTNPGIGAERWQH